MKNVTEPCSRRYASQNNCLHTFFLCDYVLMLPFWPGAPCKSNNASQETSWLNMGWIKSEICIYFLLRMLETGASDGNQFQHSTSRRYDKACVSQFETIQHLILRDTLERARILEILKPTPGFQFWRVNAEAFIYLLLFLARSNLNRINPKNTGNRF